MFVTLVIAGLIIYLVYSIKRYNRKIICPSGYKDIPYVEGGLPFVGNGIDFSKDIIGFIRRAYSKYGGIFRIKLFRKELVVVCDRNLVNDFFGASEDTLSMYNVLDDLFLRDAFAGKTQTSFKTIITLIKKTVTVKYDEFKPKIIDEATKLANRMKTSWINKKVNLTDLVIKFIANTSARCFIAIELDDDFYKEFIYFTHLLNKIIVSTYFLPKWFIRSTGGYLLKRYWSSMVKSLIPEIHKYRNDLTKKDSLVLRTAVDFVEESGTRLSDEQIGGIVIGLLYVSSENSALGLAATIMDLATHPEIWSKVKSICNSYMKKGDTDGIFNDPYIDACVTESCRLGSHIFAINRKPVNSHTALNGYYLGDIDSIALCQPMLMIYDCASDTFASAESYNPDRFIGSNKESKLSTKVLTFGSGLHLCPGKNFAILEIKAAIALITTQFKRFELPSPLPELFYFSPSAFAERDVDIVPCDIEDEIDDNCDNDSNNDSDEIYTIASKSKMTVIPTEIIINGNKVTIEGIHSETDGWVLRNVLSKEEQIQMYYDIISASKDSGSHEKIMMMDPKVVFPITYYNLTYVDFPHNCAYPEKLLSWAENVWNLLRKTDGIDFPQLDIKFNSMVAQSYTLDTVLANHYDKHVDYGVSLSLGSSCKFKFGTEEIVLNSGDLCIADFSKVNHGVPYVYDNTPGWLTDNEYELANGYKLNIETFGRCRLGTQFRFVDKSVGPEPITIDQFYELLESYKV